MSLTLTKAEKTMVEYARSLGVDLDLITIIDRLEAENRVMRKRLCEIFNLTNNPSWFLEFPND